MKTEGQHSIQTAVHAYEDAKAPNNTSIRLDSIREQPFSSGQLSDDAGNRNIQNQLVNNPAFKEKLRELKTDVDKVQKFIEGLIRDRQKDFLRRTSSMHSQIIAKAIPAADTPLTSQGGLPVIQVSNKSEDLSLEPLLNDETPRSIQQNRSTEVLNMIDAHAIKEQILVYRKLHESIGTFFGRLVKLTSGVTTTAQSDEEELHSEFCWNTVSFMFDVCQMHITDGQKSVKERSRFINEVEREIKRVLEFLQAKYSPMRGVPAYDEFMMKIPSEKAVVEDGASDMLVGSGLSHIFHQEKEEYGKEIKTLLNKMVKECRRTWPRFKEEICLLVRQVEEEDDGSSPAKIELFSMIEESVQLYTSEELDAIGLDLKFASTAQPLLKWIFELYDIFLKPEEFVNRMASFKSIVPGERIALNRKCKMLLIENLKKAAATILSNRASRIDGINSMTVELIRSMSMGFDGYEGLDRREVVVLKFSQYIYQVFQGNLLISFSALFRSLNSIRNCYDEEAAERKLDLITFSQAGILKCRVSGSKQCIYRAYKQLRRHTDTIQVVEVRNRLTTSSRDVSVFFRLKGSFMVCELQIVPNEAVTRNFFLSTMLRQIRTQPLSLFFHCSISLVQSDLTIGFFDKKHPVRFRKADVDLKKFGWQNGRLFCRNQHEASDMEYCGSLIPFMCCICNTFYSSASFGVQFLQCTECFASLCPKCTLRHWPTYQEYMIAKYANTSFVREFCQLPVAHSGFYEEKELMVKSLLLVDTAGYLLLLIHDDRSLKRRIVKEHEGVLVDALTTLTTLPKHRARDSPYNWCSIYRLKPVDRLSLDELRLYFKVQEILEEANIHEVIACVSQGKRALIVDIPEAPEAVGRVLDEIKLHESLKDELSKPEIHLELSSRSLVNLSALEMIENRNALRSLNLWENKLRSVEQLRVFPELQELYLRENSIEDITPLLAISNLQHLNLQRNRLKGKLPRLDYPEIRSFDVSCNQLVDVMELGNSNLPLLQLLVLSTNLIEQLPKLNLPRLHNLLFAANNMESLQNLGCSHLPLVKTIHCCKNRFQGPVPKLAFPLLSELWLQHNFFDGIAVFEASRFAYLQVLRLSGNRVSSALPVLRMPVLTVLHINQNDIANVDALARWETPLLQCLYLSDNRINGELPVLPFRNLNVLDLSRNRLTGIDCLAHYAGKELWQLRLNHNQIGGALPVLKLPRLVTLDLQMNRLEDVSTLAKCILPELQYLNLSQNHIRSSVPVLQFENLVEMRLFENSIQSLLFLREPQLLPRLRAIIVHLSELVLSPEEEAKFRQYRFRDESLAKKAEYERRKTYSNVSRMP